MTDEQTATVGPQATTEGGLPVDQQFDQSAALDAAEQFLNATRAELESETPPVEAKPTPARGPDGKFLKKDTAQPQEPTPAAKAEAIEPPVVDPVWTQLAKDEGLADDAIAQFKSEQEIEAAIQTQRVQKLQQAAQLLGIDGPTWHQFVQFKRGQGAAGTGQQPLVQTTQTQTQPAATTVEELKLDLDEDELDPKVLATIKALTSQVNKLGAVAADNQKLSQKLAELERHVQQSAVQAQMARQQAVYAQSWDQAAAKIPGFTEYFGKPSDLLRLAEINPNHPRIRDYIGFNAHFQPVWEIASQGGTKESDEILEKALQAAWSASPYSKISGNGRNGTNGSAQPPNGSVVRQTARRTSAREPVSAGIDAEMDRSLGTIAQAWDAKGENPFKDLGF